MDAVVEVSADVDRTMVTPESVMADIKAKLVTKLHKNTQQLFLMWVVSKKNVTRALSA